MINQLPLFQIVDYILLMIYMGILFIFSYMFIRRYYKYKKDELLYVGLAWFFAPILYLPYIASFFSLLIFGQDIDVIIPIIFLSIWPLIIFIWTIAFVDLMYEKKRKVILAVILSFFIILELIYYIFLIIGGTGAIAAVPYPVITLQFTLFANIFQFIPWIIFLLTLFVFSVKAIRSTNEVTKLKGWFILFAGILLTVSFLFESVLPIPAELASITKIFQYLSIGFFYIGFVLPNRIRDFFIKNN